MNKEACEQQSKPDLSKRFGRFYTGETVCRKLSISSQELAELVSRHQVLCVETSDDKKVYPEFQFDNDGKVNPDIAGVLKILLPVSADGWVVLYWLTSPLANLGHRTSVDVIRTGMPREIRHVLGLAKEDATAWQR